MIAEEHNNKNREYRGIGTGSGIAMAKAVIVHRGEAAIPVITLEPEKIEQEIARFRESLFISREQLLKIRATVAKTMGEEAAGVIDAQLMLLSDPFLVDETEKLIKLKRVNAEHALDTVIQGAIESLGESKDPTFQDRVHDLNDIRGRIISNLLGLKGQTIPMPEEESILIISHLAPSETAQLFGSKYVGLVTEIGGFTSHIAIMSRTMNLPAVLGVENATEEIKRGEKVIVNSMKGIVIVNPDEETEKSYNKLKSIYIKRRKLIEKYIPKKAVTPDGHKVSVGANMELPEEVPMAKHFGADGIGLFRTELLYMKSDKLPSEDEQFEVYKNIASQIRPDSAIIRTFDVGGDKFAGILTHHHYEPNPFLGWRAIRIGLEYPEILKTQICAILRASNFGNLKIMFPMISLPEELKRARELVEECKDILRKRGEKFNEKIEVGIMVEVPSAAILSRKLAEMCDFMSIGTNDLIQYTLAADRGNPRVAHIYQSYQPAVLKLIKMTIDSAHLEGRWAGLCGEFAGYVLAVPLLLGMGLDEFSVVPARVPLVKTIINHFPYSEARIIAEEVMQFTTEEEVVSYLSKRVKEFLPKEIIEFEVID